MNTKKIVYYVLLAIGIYVLFKISKFLYYSENTDNLLGSPINIESHIVIPLKKDIHNYIESTIDISLRDTVNIEYLRHDDFDKYEKMAKKIFPENSVKICLYNSNNKKRKYCRFNSDGFDISKNDLFTSFSFYDIAEHTTFNRLEIETSIPLKNVKIGWRNWKM